jgi:transcription elongation GreA/GreB family factor
MSVFYVIASWAIRACHGVAVSKAFTKEDDGSSEAPSRRRGVPVPALNMVTPGGLRAARAELDALIRARGDEDRIRELADHLATAQVMEPPADRASIGLGASVSVEDEAGVTHVYRIVGAIEADPKRGAIAWQTPIAQALWGLRVGDRASLPRGDVEIVAVGYVE